MTLWMEMIIGEESHGVGCEISGKSKVENCYGAAIDLRWVCSSEYAGTFTSTVKTLPGSSSRVAMVSEYSTCSPGLIKSVPGFSANARFSDHRVTTRPVESWSK